MTSGDEPMLSHSGDRSPMISSPDTKPRSYSALINQMDDSQRLLLRQGVVRLIYAHCAPRIAALDYDIRQSFDYVECWLNDAHDAHLEEALQTLLSSDTVRGYDDDDSPASPEIVALSMMLVIASEPLLEIHEAAVQAIELLLPQRADLADKSMRRWMLDSAWSLLQRREPPPFVMITP